MAALQIYDKLLQFPLFQGMSRDDLELVAGHTRFGFSKVQQGKAIVRADEPCTQLFFLINGSVIVETVSDDRSYKVVEQMAAPFILQPEVIFGYNQRYTHTFTARSDVNLIAIDKEEVLRLSEDFLVFRLNLLNLMATQTQRLTRQPWRACPASLTDRIVRFLARHCIYPAGPKVFHILMNQLADELNDSRLNVSRALNQLQQENKIVLGRGRIEIAQMEQLLM